MIINVLQNTEVLIFYKCIDRDLFENFILNWFKLYRSHYVL